MAVRGIRFLRACHLSSSSSYRSFLRYHIALCTVFGANTLQVEPGYNYASAHMERLLTSLILSSFSLNSTQL